MRSQKFKKIFSFLFIFFLSSIKAQDNNYNTLPFKLALKWAPFGIFDLFSGPNMKLGIDYRYHNKVYGGLDAGMIIIPYPPTLKNDKGFFVRKEIKKFRVSAQDYMNGAFYYSGFEFMYKYQEFDRGDSIKIPGAIHTFKNYHIFKNSFILHAKVGGIIYFNGIRETVPEVKDMPVFFLEIFAAAGIRQTTVLCSGLTDKEANNREIPPTLDLMFTTLNGFRVWPSFELAMKFGWRLK